MRELLEDWSHIKRKPPNRTELRVLVYGASHFQDWDLLKGVLDRHGPTTIIHGHGRGVDFLCSLYAQIFGIDELRFPAHWIAHGANAPSIRNAKMFSVGKPDIVIDLMSGDNEHDLRRRALIARVALVTVDPGERSAPAINR
jgi:hypothetical protein